MFRGLTGPAESSSTKVMNVYVGIQAKLRRAEHHIEVIRSEANRVCADVERRIVREAHEDVDEQVWIYRGETPDAPVEWSIIVGEILYNLRSALDHLVWQLVIANGQTPGRHNEFPVTTNHEGWQKVKDSYLRGMSERHKRMIGYVQPYTGGINLPFDVSMLKVLNDLGNIEKHRHLILSVIASRGIAPIVFEDTDLEVEGSTLRKPLSGSGILGKVESEKVLLRFNNAHTDPNPSFQIDVCFGPIEGSSLTARPVLPTLDRCLRAAKGTVEFLTTSMGRGFVEFRSA